MSSLTFRQIYCVIIHTVINGIVELIVYVQRDKYFYCVYTVGLNICCHYISNGA